MFENNRVDLRDKHDKRGVMMRVAHDIFSNARGSIAVTCRFYELYNDQIRDLTTGHSVNSQSKVNR